METWEKLAALGLAWFIGTGTYQTYQIIQWLHAHISISLN
jgi:hypothetical protein